MQCQGWQVKCVCRPLVWGQLMLCAPWISCLAGGATPLCCFCWRQQPQAQAEDVCVSFPRRKKSQPSLKTKGSPFQLHECWQQTTSVFCQLKNKWNVWQRRIWVGKITWYILYMKIEDIFLLNAAVITGNSSIQTGTIPITRIWSRAISRTWRRKSHFVFKFIYLWYLPHLDWQ